MAKHTAVLAAVVAAASLAITAWGTYKAAQVADDQLAQSRENNENDERAQASRISMWTEGNQPTRIVLANRSLDPAWASIYFDDPTLPMGLSQPAGVLPPCSRLDVPVAKLYVDPENILGSGLRLAFVDANGRAWTRAAGGGLRGPEWPNSVSVTTKDKTTMWATEKDVEVKTLSECGQAAHPNQ
ncbi:hypothetical protein ABZV75_37725 [Streptomyces flaveolus]|uniref:hypothetical protein n=1 Tax=Streptomyces TaxID=1883 RepID=UPI00339F15EC